MRNKVVNFFNEGKSSVKARRNLMMQSVCKQPSAKTSKEVTATYMSKNKASHKKLHKHLTEWCEWDIK